jgi:hypothetical protein
MAQTMRAFVMKQIGQVGVMEKPIPGQDQATPLSEPQRRSSAPQTHTPWLEPSENGRTSR